MCLIMASCVIVLKEAILKGARGNGDQFDKCSNICLSGNTHIQILIL